VGATGATGAKGSATQKKAERSTVLASLDSYARRVIFTRLPLHCLKNGVHIFIDGFVRVDNFMEKPVGLVTCGAGYRVLVHARKVPGSNLVLELVETVLTIGDCPI
jgi:hypothetical protein